MQPPTRPGCGTLGVALYLLWIPTANISNPIVMMSQGRPVSTLAV